MKIIIENDIEKKSIDDIKLSKIKKIIGNNISVDLVEADVMLNDINRLSWQMGKKQYHKRDELYDR